MSHTTAFRATLAHLNVGEQRAIVRLEDGTERVLECVYQPEMTRLVAALTARPGEAWDAVPLIISTNPQRDVLYDWAHAEEEFACAQCCDLFVASHDGVICDDCRDAALEDDDADGVGAFDTQQEARDH